MFFYAWSMCMRQEWLQGNDRRRWGFTLPVFYFLILIVSTLYENFITSRITVPGEVKPFSNLEEIMLRGFRVGYSIPLSVNVKKLNGRYLETLLNQVCLKLRLDCETTVLALHLDEQIKKFNSQQYFSDKNALVTLANAEALRRTAQAAVPDRKCFQVMNPTGSIFRYAVFRSPDREILRQTAWNFMAGGLPKRWKDFDAFQKRSIKGIKHRTISSFISLRHLSSLLCIWALQLLLSFLVCLIEIYYKRQPALPL
jgi:hypothetical protein